MNINKIYRKFSVFMMIFGLFLGNYSALSGFDSVYLWHRWMQYKYPQAGLQSIICGNLINTKDEWFYVPDENLINVPKESLFWGDYGDNQWSTLHEAGHAKNEERFMFKHDQKIRVGTILGSSILSVWLTIKLSKLIQGKSRAFAEKHPNLNKMLMIGFEITAAIGLAVLFHKLVACGKDRVGEVLADRFANQHADLKALAGSYKYFMGHDAEFLQKPWFKRVMIRLNDLEHPADLDRAQKIRQAALQRFDVDIATK